MKEFVTILHEDPGAGKDLSPADIQGMIQAYMEWTKELRDAGKLVAEKSLNRAAGTRIAGYGPNAVVSEGPFSETAEVVGGLHVIQVESKDEALAWAKKCPALHGSAWIELREVESWNG